MAPDLCNYTTKYIADKHKWLFLKKTVMLIFVFNWFHELLSNKVSYLLKKQTEQFIKSFTAE
jgi:hypothetical protein